MLKSFEPKFAIRVIFPVDGLPELVFGEPEVLKVCALAKQIKVHLAPVATVAAPFPRTDHGKRVITPSAGGTQTYEGRISLHRTW